MLITLSCKKVIHYTVEGSSSQIVIEGNINDVDSIASVHLSYSNNIDADSFYIPISNAAIKLEDITINKAVTLSETVNGMYQAGQIHGVAGHTYELTVTIGDTTLHGKSNLPSKVPLDSVSVLLGKGYDHANNIALHFQDPPGLKNYYLCLLYVNGEKPKQLFAFNDRLIDGKYQHMQLYNANLNMSDTVKVIFENIDQAVYEYFKEISGLDPINLQPVTPVNPVSNLFGGALGYFSAYTYQSAIVVIK